MAGQDVQGMTFSLGRIVQLDFTVPWGLVRWLLSSVLWFLILLEAQLRFPPHQYWIWNPGSVCTCWGRLSYRTLSPKWRCSEGRCWVAEQRGHCTSQTQHGNHIAQHHCEGTESNSSHWLEAVSHFSRRAHSVCTQRHPRKHLECWLRPKDGRLGLGGPFKGYQMGFQKREWSAGGGVLARGVS